MSSKKQDGLQKAKRISEILTPSSSSKDPLVQEKLSQLRELVGPDPLDDELIEALRQNTNDVHGAFETLQQTSKDSWSTQTRSRKKPTGPSTTAPSTRGNHANRTSSGSRGRGQRTRGGSESRGGSEARSGSHGRGHSRSAEVRSTHVPAPAAVHPQPLDGTAETAVSTPVPAPASAPPSNPKAHVTVEVHHKAPQSNSTKKTYASVTGQTQNNRAPSNQRGGPRGPSARGGSAAGGSHHRGPHREHHPEAVQPPAPKPWLNAALKSVAVKTPVAQHPPVDAPKQPEPIPEELTHVEPEPEPVPQTLPSQVHIEASIGTSLPVESAPYVIDTHTSSPPAPEPIAAPQQPPAQFDIPLFTSGDAFQENPKIRFGSFHSNSPHESATVTSTHDSQADHAQNSNLVNTQQSLQSQQTFSQSQAPQPTASSPPPQSQPRSQSGQHVDDKLSGRHPSHTGVMHLPPDFHHGQQPFHPHYLPPAFPPMFTQYEHAAELMGLPPAHLAAAPGSLTHPESAKTGQAGLRMPSPTGGSPTAPAEAAAPGSQPYHPSPYPNTPIGGLPLYYGAPYVPYPYQPSQFNPPYPRAPSAAYFKPPYPGNYPTSGTHSYPSEDMIHPTDYMYSPPGYYMGDTRQSSQSVSQTKPGDGSNDISQAQGPPPTSQGQSPMRYDPPYYPPWPSYPNA